MTSTASVQKVLGLDRNNLLRIYDGEGLRLTPASGVVWITEEESANDTVLLPGDTHQLEKPGLALVHAHRAARIMIELPAGTAAPRRVDFALAGGAPTRRVAFPTRGRDLLGRWGRYVIVAIRKALARAVAERNYRMRHARDGSSRHHPFPYY